MNPVLNRLYSLVKQNRLPHALALVGDTKPLLSEMAQKLIQFHFCSEQNKPCQKCLPCQKVAENIHPDVFYVQTDKQELSIDLIRQLQIWIQRGPYESTLKFGVIYDAHLMNLEAQNAVLKTLEEPPPYGKLILLTSAPDRFLPTILSRLQWVRLPRTEESLIDPDDAPEWVPELNTLLLKKKATSTDIFPVTEEIGKERKDLGFFFETFETFLKNKLADPETDPIEFEKAAKVFEASLRAEQEIFRRYGNSQLALDNLLLSWFA